MPCDALNERSTATKTVEKDRSCAEAGCTKGACVDGIVMQHSWLWSWLCGEQGMLLQHCIASSGVVMAPQSIAYRAIATAMTMSNIGFIRRMSIKVCASSVAVKTGCRGHLDVQRRCTCRGSLFQACWPMRSFERPGQIR